MSVLRYDEAEAKAAYQASDQQRDWYAFRDGWKAHIEMHRLWRNEYVRIYYVVVPEDVPIPDATPYDYFPAFGLHPDGGICFNKPQVQENSRKMVALLKARGITMPEEGAEMPVEAAKDTVSVPEQMSMVPPR